MKSLKELILEKRKKLRELIAAGFDTSDVAKEIDVVDDYNVFNLFGKTNRKADLIAEVGTSMPDTLQCRDELLRQTWQDYMAKKHPETVEIADNYRPGTFLLVDARREVCEASYHLWGHLENVAIAHFAVADESGFVDMHWAAGSTFIDGIKSPRVVNTSKPLNDTFSVRGEKFSVIDNGRIDVLIADIEGSEWFVIKHMTSRPMVIVLETHSLNPDRPDHEYINPFIDKIDVWMQNNNYKRYKMKFGDTIFLREDFYQELNL